MMFQDKARRRRSDRLMFSIPLRVEGVSEKGEPFACSGRATAVNRYGGQIRLDRLVDVGRQVRLTNLDNGASGDFRVVGMLAASSSDQVEFGAEALGDEPTFWGIDFPPRPKKPRESRALLECQRCRAARFLPLSLSEVDVLESGGLLLQPCLACQTETAWGYAMQAAGADGVPPLAEPRAPAPREEREDRRAFVQRPISIRTVAGGVDQAQTESLSKRELNISSEKTYEVNQEVTLEWANPSTGLRAQARGRVLRRHSIGGSRRKIYSIRYESPITALPAAPPGKALGHYAAFGVLIAAAAALLESNLAGLASTLFVPAFAYYRVADHAGVLLLVSLAYLVWRAILRREPEARQSLKRRHRIISRLVAVVFLGALALGGARGCYRGYERVHVQRLLRDLALAGALESNIDAAEHRALVSPSDYQDACATLELLAGPWQERIATLSADAAGLARLPHHRTRAALKRLQEALGISRRKLELVQRQAALAAQAQRLPPPAQAAFWQANFVPLRQQILDLNSRKLRLLTAPAADDQGGLKESRPRAIN